MLNYIYQYCYYGNYCIYWDEKIEYSEVLGGTEKDLKTGPAKVIWQAVPAR